DAGEGDTFLLWLLIHALLFMPTLALSASMAFHNLADQARQFPLIRVFGTIGWIAANWVVSLGLGVDATDTGFAVAAQQFHVAAAAGILLGLFCFTLPHTPAPDKDRKTSVAEAFGLGALTLLRRPSFLVF